MDFSPFQAAESNEGQMNESSAIEHSVEHSVEAVIKGFTSPELMTGQGITIRDPETGAIYVQTQLLQVGYSSFCS